MSVLELELPASSHIIPSLMSEKVAESATGIVRGTQARHAETSSVPENNGILDHEDHSGNDKPGTDPLGADSGIKLSSEQEAILRMVALGQSLFFTGPAGTGKSVLLRSIIAECRSRFPYEDSVAVTAPTGIAALTIGGSTIHSWAGIGLGKDHPDILARKIRSGHDRIVKEEAKRRGMDVGVFQHHCHTKTINSPLLRWRRCKVLIVDESGHNHHCYFIHINDAHLNSFDAEWYVI